MDNYYTSTPSQTTRRPLIIMALMIVALVLGFFIFRLIYVSFIKPPNVELVTLPDDATIKISDTEYRPGKIHLESGLHEITVAREGFKTQVRSISVEQDDEIRTVQFLLQPSSEDARNYIRENARSYAEAEARGAELATEDGENFRKKNPIASVLPYKGVLYSIDYKASPVDSSRIIIVVDSKTSSGRSFAIQKIRSMGYDPVDYKIEYRNFSTNISRVNK